DTMSPLDFPRYPEHDQGIQNGMDEPMPADEAEEPQVWVNGEIFEP
ncbi:unnamed protein product, partial [Allacma fusca]